MFSSVSAGEVGRADAESRADDFRHGQLVFMALFTAIWALIPGCLASHPGETSKTAHPIAAINRRALADILHRAQAEPPPASPPFPSLVVVTATKPPELALIKLTDGSTAWSRPFSGGLRPILADDLVLTSDNSTITAFQTSDGTLRFVSPLPPGETMGVARSSKVVFVVTQQTAERATLTAFDAGSGSLSFQLDIPGQAGAPAAAGSVVLVPVQGQSLRAFDANTGSRLGRIDTTDDVWAFIRIKHGHVWVGDKNAYKLTPEYDGTSNSAVLQPSSLPSNLPGHPSAFPSSFVPPPSHPTAHGRISVGDNLTTGHAYFTFFKHIYGFDRDGKLVWARKLSADIARSTSTPKGVAVVTVDGRVLHLAAKTGALHQLANVGVPVASAAFSPSSQTVECAHTSTLVSNTSPLAELRKNLRTMVMDRDARLLPSRLTALRALAVLPEAEATKDLLDIIQTKSDVPSQLTEAAAHALSTRASGHTYIFQALSTRYDRLTRQPSPPLWALAPAVAKLNLTAALPWLEQHLLDHETATADLVPLARAINELAANRPQTALYRLLSRHRTDSTLLESRTAFRALSHLLAETGTQAMLDHMTRWILAPSTDPAKAIIFATATKNPTIPTERKSPTPPTPVQTTHKETVPRLPNRLNAQAVARAFEPFRTEMATCIAAYQGKRSTPQRIRIITQVDSRGRPLARHCLPQDPGLSACLNAQLSEQTFAASRLPQQLVTFSTPLVTDVADGIDATDLKKNGAALAKSSQPKPWWAQHVIAEANQTPRKAVPWWQDQNPMTIWVEQAPARLARKVLPKARPRTLAEPTLPPAPNNLLDPAPETVTPWWTPVEQNPLRDR